MGSQPIRIQFGKILRKNLAGQGGGEKANLRKAVIGGNRVDEGDDEPTNQDPAWENLAGKSYRIITHLNA